MFKCIRSWKKIMYFSHLTTTLCHQVNVPMSPINPFTIPTRNVIGDNLYDQFIELQRKQNQEKGRTKHKSSQVVSDETRRHAYLRLVDTMMQYMCDILNRIAEQNGWPTPPPLSDMYERFPPSNEEAANDEEDKERENGETPIVPLDCEWVFWPDHSSTKGVVICNTSHHSSTQTLGKQATKASVGHERGKAPMMKNSKPDSN